MREIKRKIEQLMASDSAGIPVGREFCNPEFPVPENWHEDFIVHLASIVRPKLYLELGLYHCDVFNRILPYADHLIGVDKDPTSRKWISKSRKVRFVNSTTQEFARELYNTKLKIDMLFIDADHSEKAVLDDFGGFFPFVCQHGVVILHDTCPKNEFYIQSGYCGDAYKAIERLSRNATEYEMVTIPVHPGLTLCRKRESQLPWKEHNSRLAEYSIKDCPSIDK
ncbi:MAG: class I SAM-dependent methyltransferase [Candidatus Bathyarchaeia archaeon]